MNIKNLSKFYSDYNDFNIKYIFEPLLLTSLLLLPISFIYFNKKYYLLAALIFFNGIASYLYHLKHHDEHLYQDEDHKPDEKLNEKPDEKPDEKSDEKSDEKPDEKPYEILENKFYVFDCLSTCTSFILSFYLAKDLSKNKKYKLSILVLIAFIFYGLNHYYESYNYHLIWHIFILLGQLFLALNVKNKI